MVKTDVFRRDLTTSLRIHCFKNVFIQFLNMPQICTCIRFDFLYHTVIDKSNKIMDDLREMRSELEGTNVTFEKTFINEAALQQLKQLTLMHVPGSLTADIKDKMSQLVREVFQGRLAVATSHLPPQSPLLSTSATSGVADLAGEDASMHVSICRWALSAGQRTREVHPLLV